MIYHFDLKIFWEHREFMTKRERDGEDKRQETTTA